MIWRRLEQVAAEAPDRIAVIDGRISLTYRELLERSAAMADLLRSRFQLSEGRVAALSLPNCWQYPVCFFAVARLGAVFMPFNSQWRASEIRWFLERLGIGMAITSTALRSVWDDVESVLPRERVLTIDAQEMPALPGDFEAPAQSRTAAADGARPVLYLATSGSTGRPKIVPRSQRNLLAGRDAVAGALGVRPGQRFLSVVPFHHANGFANCLFLPLTSGATLVIARAALPSALVECVRRERVQVLNMSPFLYSILADHDMEAAALASVEICLSSGAPLPDELAIRWRERFGLPIRQLYGSSETGTMCIEDPDSPMVPGSVGKPLAPVTVQVLDPEGAPLPPDCVGEIAVRSPAMMSGYVDEPDLNRQAFHEGFFRTGDLGRLNGEGVLVLTGRSRRWINSGGVKVDPVEVENVIGRMPGVRWCKVRPTLNARRLEVISATVAMGPSCVPSRRAIVEHCRTCLAEYKIPRTIQFVEDAPADLAGKTPMEWLAK